MECRSFSRRRGQKRRADPPQADLPVVPPPVVPPHVVPPHVVPPHVVPPPVAPLQAPTPREHPRELPPRQTLLQNPRCPSLHSLRCSRKSRARARLESRSCQFLRLPPCLPVAEVAAGVEALPVYLPEGEAVAAGAGSGQLRRTMAALR